MQCFIFIFTSLWSFSPFSWKATWFCAFCLLFVITLLNQFSSSVHMLCNLWNFSPKCPSSQSSIFHKADLYLVASNMGFGFVTVLFSFGTFLGFPFHYVLHFFFYHFYYKPVFSKALEFRVIFFFFWNNC